MQVTDKSQLNNAGMCRLLRHGRSLANEAGIVISQRVSVVGTAAVPVGTCIMMNVFGYAQENGIKPEYALAPVGQEQAVKAG